MLCKCLNRRLGWAGLIRIRTFVSDPQPCYPDPAFDTSADPDTASETNANPDPASKINADPDPASETNADPEPGDGPLAYLNSGVPDVRQVPFCVILEIIGHRDPEGALPPLQIVLVDHAYKYKGTEIKG